MMTERGDERILCVLFAARHQATGNRSTDLTTTHTHSLIISSSHLLPLLIRSHTTHIIICVPITLCFCSFYLSDDCVTTGTERWASACQKIQPPAWFTHIQDASHMPADTIRTGMCVQNRWLIMLFAVSSSSFKRVSCFPSLIGIRLTWLESHPVKKLLADWLSHRPRGYDRTLVSIHFC